MSGTAALVAGLLTGLLIGGALAWIILATRGRRTADRLIHADARADMLERRLEEVGGEAREARARREEADAAREAAANEATRLATELEAARRRHEEQVRLLQSARAEMTDAFKALGAETLQANSNQFMQLARSAFQGLLTEAKGDAEKRQQAMGTLMGGIREMLEKQNTTLVDIEKKRAEEKSGLEVHLRKIARDHEKLDAATDELVGALRRPNQRGRWGEMQLRNVVELAGMTEHCDFELQTTARGVDGAVRPDLLVRLPGGGRIVVDAKTPLDAYLDMLDAGADRPALLQKHAQHLATHMRQLAAKRYWEQFEHTPKLVVMFVPLEAALVAALEASPQLHADGMRQNVLLATPTLLVALLRAVAFGWQQEDVAANAREIARTGRDLYERVGTFLKHFEKVGDGLRSAGNAYNKAVGSVEARLLPSARELRGLHVSTDAEPETPQRVLTEIRPIVAAEMKPLSDPAEDLKLET